MGFRRAFTLIEMLMVVSILAVLAAMMAGGVFRSLRKDPVIEGMQKAEQFLRTQRQLAALNGPITLRCEETRIIAVGKDQNQTLAECGAPDGVTWLWRKPSENIDARGRMEDVLITVLHPKGRASRLILGISGQSIEQ